MTQVPCWICGDPATTAEHKTKKSDLKSAFGKPTQKSPIFYHDAKARNQRINTLDAKLVKSTSLLCEQCNTTRTQPFDRAWEQMSEHLRFYQPNIATSAVVRANRVFRYGTRRSMLHVHLYFVKLFGCHIKEHNMAIALAPFASAILSRKAHPNVYIKIGRAPTLDGLPMTGTSDAWLAMRKDDQVCRFATWFYYIEELGVNVMYAIPGEKRDGLIGAWHPRFGTNRLHVGDF
ncbi:MAG: hypothetical protein ACKVRO_01625 [Micropepsaceae bacterium]